MTFKKCTQCVEIVQPIDAQWFHLCVCVLSTPSSIRNDVVILLFFVSFASLELIYFVIVFFLSVICRK